MREEIKNGCACHIRQQDNKADAHMILMLFYYIAVRMPLAYLFSYIGWGLNGIWFAVLVSHVAANAAAGICEKLSFKKTDEHNLS